MKRILIAGIPKAGKTRLADKLGAELGIEPKHADDLIGRLEWSAASLEVSAWMEDSGPFIVEGVAVVRAVRKWLGRNPEGAPADVVYWGEHAFLELTKGQLTMAKGCITVWNEIREALIARGVRVLPLPEVACSSL